MWAFPQPAFFLVLSTHTHTDVCVWIVLCLKSYFSVTMREFEAVFPTSVHCRDSLSSLGYLTCFLAHCEKVLECWIKYNLLKIYFYSFRSLGLLKVWLRIFKSPRLFAFSNVFSFLTPVELTSMCYYSKTKTNKQTKTHIFSWKQHI